MVLPAVRTAKTAKFVMKNVEAILMLQEGSYLQYRILSCLRSMLSEEAKQCRTGMQYAARSGPNRRRQSLKAAMPGARSGRGTATAAGPAQRHAACTAHGDELRAATAVSSFPDRTRGCWSLLALDFAGGRACGLG